MSAVPRGLTPPAVGIAGVAGITGYSYDHVQANWRAWAAELGFPAPRTGAGKGQHPRWSSKAVMAWLEGAAGASSTVQPAQPEAPKPAANDPVSEVFSAADDPVAALLAAAGG